MQLDHTRKTTSIPSCFISYSWDNLRHKSWVRDLAERLQNSGVATKLDQWDVRPGTDFIYFMESAIRESDYVLLICTPAFCKKANERRGGVGYEGAIVTGELFRATHDQTKFVPILRKGNEATSLPSYLSARACLDFRDAKDSTASFTILLRHIYGEPLYQRPCLGDRPEFGTKRRRPQSFLTIRPAATLKRRPPSFERSVFLNCPLDKRSILDAQVFTVCSCAFTPRNVLESNDSTSIRLERIFALMASCKYSIHEITPSIQTSGMPRFNIPFELGMWTAIQRADRRSRVSLILDKREFAYKRYLSDISGLDIHSYKGNLPTMIKIIRDWLAINSPDEVPSAATITQQYKAFRVALPKMASLIKGASQGLLYSDYVGLVQRWLGSSHSI